MWPIIARGQLHVSLWLVLLQFLRALGVTELACGRYIVCTQYAGRIV
jgi:hypothetical protein